MNSVDPLERHPRADDGQVGGVEALIFGVLVFILGMLVMAGAWAVVDAKMATSAAAREAARAVAEAPAGSDIHGLAADAAASALAGHGRSPARLHVSLSGSFSRCGRITAEVGYDVPLVRVPLLGGLGPGVRAAARHSELVDPYRTGLAGVARCG